MGLFDGLMGNASEVNLDKLQEEMKEILIPNETIQNAYKIIRDTFIFTNKRLILIDKQGVTGKKTEYHSIPYKNILHFSVETAGTFDLDAELKIWVSGSQLPIQKNFNKSTNIYKVQSVFSRICVRLVFNGRLTGLKLLIVFLPF
ncbi:Cytoplasmic protein OS=Lysinibacillus sphaericus OX=1421 GN=LS41612_09185 PE=4 SV=1 [Lysinibacillus sphaericus]